MELQQLIPPNRIAYVKSKHTYMSNRNKKVIIWSRHKEGNIWCIVKNGNNYIQFNNSVVGLSCVPLNNQYKFVLGEILKEILTIKQPNEMYSKYVSDEKEYEKLLSYLTLESV